MELAILEFTQESVEFERAWGNLKVKTTINEAKIALNESFLLEEEQEAAKEKSKGNFVGNAKEQLSKMINSIMEFVSKQTKAIGDAINNAVSKVANSAVGQKVAKLKESGKKFVPFKIKVPQIDVKAAMDGVKEKAVQYKEIALNSWDSLLSFIKGLPAQIKNNKITISGLKQKFREAQAQMKFATSPEGIQKAKEKIASIRLQISILTGAASEVIRKQIGLLGQAIKNATGRGGNSTEEATA